MHKIFYFWLLTTILLSCTSKTKYSSYKTIDKHIWKKTDTISFVVENTDTISKKNVFINVRNNKDYEFSSIFIIAKIKFPKGTQIIDTLQYAMTNTNGKWLGKGITDIKENKLWYKENVIFTEKGNYTFTITNATRSFKDTKGKEPLKGITNIGLSIENAK